MPNNTTTMITMSKVTTALLSVLEQRFPRKVFDKLPKSQVEQRALLGDILISSNLKWDDKVLSDIDDVWSEDKNLYQSTKWSDVPNKHVISGTHVGVYKGDITTLEIDAIVNAANDQGLGCFVPEHRCIDNTIHRRAGPRLREAARTAMMARGFPLSAGTEPIVTEGFHLPSKHVVHVTGPQVSNGAVSEDDRKNLQLAYCQTLDVCLTNGIRSVAFCGISTGLFGFPQDQAADIAISTVLQWLEEHPGAMEAVIFDVFSEEDESLYLNRFSALLPNTNTADQGDLTCENTVAVGSIEDCQCRVAKKWIDEADAVLICAGAGMSVKEGEMVYVNPQDFAKYYPFFLKWGYKTSYEAMGLGFDPRVPQAAKWGFWANHMNNLGWAFSPNEAYSTLLSLVKEKDTFVLTSNVDRCFERSGFPKDRIYTPQGEWTYYQCTKPCRPDAVFESREMLDTVLPSINEEGFAENIPVCPHCGGDVFGNVRADGSFIHSKYDAQNDKLRGWMRSMVNSNKTVAVIEIGAGFNTPMVTRFPVESFTRDLGKRGKLIRINPTDPEIPSNLDGLSLPEGWQVLLDIKEAPKGDSFDEERIFRDQKKNGMVVPSSVSARYAKHFGHFDWNKFLLNLKD